MTLALRAAQVPEVPLEKMERRASQGIPVTQDETAPSKARRATEEIEEHKGELGGRGHKAVLAPEEAGEWKVGGDSGVPRGKQETRGFKVHRDQKDCKAHRGPVEILARKEKKEVKGTRGLRVLLGQQDLGGALEDLGFGGERGNLEFLEAQDQ